MITKKVSSRYQLKFDPSVLARYFATGTQAAITLYSAMHNFKADNVNVSADTGIIAYTLFGKSNGPDRVRDIEETVFGVIETALTTPEEELRAIIEWAIPIVQDNPHFGTYPIDREFLRVARLIIDGGDHVSFVGTMRRASQT